MVVAGVSLAGLVFTCKYHLGGNIGHFGCAGMHGCAMIIVHVSPVKVPWCWFERQRWSIPRWFPAMYGGYTALSIPLWIPTLAAAIAALVLHSQGRVAHRGRCRFCDYDLTGNTSGICPECGGSVESR